MRITSIEIQQHQFKSRLFGYDTTAVDQFLEMLADEVERLHLQNNELKESLARTGAALDQMRDREKLLQQTLVTAQKMTDELKEQARRDAEIVLAEAHIEAERMLRDAAERRLRLINETREIQRIRQSFKHSLRALLDNHAQLLELDAEMVPIDSCPPDQLQSLQVDDLPEAAGPSADD